MKFSLLKKMGAVACCAAVLCSSMMLGSSAADKVNLKNIVLYVAPESKKAALIKEDEAYNRGFIKFDDGYVAKKENGEPDENNKGDNYEGYIEKADGTAATVREDKDHRFCDGNSFVTYKLPLKKGGKQAKVVLTLAAGYKVWKSAENKFADANVVADSGGAKGPSNKGDVVVDVQDILDAGNEYVYIRVGDDTPADGNGGQIFRVALIYGDYTTQTEAPLPKETVAKNFQWDAGTALEKSYLHQEAGQFAENMYFMDSKAVRIYQIPYDDTKDSTLSMDLAQDYAIYMSIDTADQKKYTLIDENDAEKNGTGKGNRGIRSYSLNRYKGTGAKFVYVGIADRDPSDGNGGCIYFMKFNFGNESGLYQPYVSKNAAYQAPAKISPTGKQVEPASSKPAPVSSKAPVSSVEEVSSEVASSDFTSSEEVSSVNEDSSTTSTSAPPEEKANNTIWYIVIGGIAVLILAAVVVQYVLMEKKRKAE